MLPAALGAQGFVTLGVPVAVGYRFKYFKLFGVFGVPVYRFKYLFGAPLVPPNAPTPYVWGFPQFYHTVVLVLLLENTTKWTSLVVHKQEPDSSFGNRYTHTHNKRLMP